MRIAVTSRILSARRASAETATLEVDERRAAGTDGPGRTAGGDSALAGTEDSTRRKAVIASTADAGATARAIDIAPTPVAAGNSLPLVPPRPGAKRPRGQDDEPGYVVTTLQRAKGLVG